MNTPKTVRGIASAIDRLALQVAKRVQKMTETQRLAALQMVANMDDFTAFDAVVLAQTVAPATDDDVEPP